MQNQERLQQDTIKLTSFLDEKEGENNPILPIIQVLTQEAAKIPTISLGQQTTSLQVIKEGIIFDQQSSYSVDSASFSLDEIYYNVEFSTVLLMIRELARRKPVSGGTFYVPIIDDQNRYVQRRDLSLKAAQYCASLLNRHANGWMSAKAVIYNPSTMNTESAETSYYLVEISHL